jgi:hypothetical protein
VGLVLLLISIPYGITTTYIAMYGKAIGIENGIGLFFTLVAIGTAISRIFSVQLVDKGKIMQVITYGLFLVVFVFLPFQDALR